MSDHIPFEIQSEIIKRVQPVKSLIRFRSVCKEWKSLIDSSEFMTHHLLNNSNTQPHHLLIRYLIASDLKFVSIVDEDNDNDNDIDTFPQHKSYPTLPPTVTNELMFGSSHGLVCFFNFDRELPSRLIVVWNPSIRKSLAIVPPVNTYIVGFGVCPITSDLKIVAITSRYSAEVLTLSTRVWRSVPINLFPRPIAFLYNQVVIDGVIHWVAYDPNEEESRNWIIKFDLASEEFGQVALPDGIVDFGCARILRFKDSLAVIDFREDDAGKLVSDVWVMFKNGVTKPSFTKLFSVQHNLICNRVIGCRKNGQPIAKLRDGFVKKELEGYESISEHVNGLGINSLFFNMVNYTESLLLLNHPDSIIE